MGTITLTLPVAGNQITAGLHSSNYAAIQSAINGNIENVNIKSNAAIAVSKLAAGTDGYYLKTTAGVPTWTIDPASKIYRKTTEKDIQNTAVETDLLNGEITVAAGDMSTNLSLNAILNGDFLDNAAGTARLRVKFGGTTILDSSLDSAVNDTDRRPWELAVRISNLGANNSQFTIAKLFVGSETVGTTGIGNWGSVAQSIDNADSAAIAPMGSTGTTSIDTSAACAFVVTVEWSVASVNLSFRLKYARIEIS